ncbi:Membrane protein [Sporosarcina sp. ANT_H38]
MKEDGCYMKNTLIISMFYLVGLLFLALGISMMILSNLGAGPWDAMYVALSESVGLTVGSWVFIVGVLLIIINSLLLKGTPDFLAIITIVLIGALIDFWLLGVFPDFTATEIGMRIFMLIAGILIIGLGISLYLQSSFARNPVDNLMMTLQSLTGKSLAVTKTVMEVSILVLAFFIGGPIGIGTIIVTFAIGPLIQMFYPPVTKFKNRICRVKV